MTPDTNDASPTLTTRILPLKHRDRFGARSTAALICAGPSLEHADIPALRATGMPVIALNRAYQWAPSPDAWIGFDRPMEFAPEIWHDADVPKFTHARNRGLATPRLFRAGKPQPTRAALLRSTCWLPVVDQLPPARYWTAPTLCWGLETGGERLASSRLTFLACFRIAYELGIRRLYLLGVDWHTTPEKSYAGSRTHSETHCESLNARFEAYNDVLTGMAPGFLARGLEVFNTTPGSRLTAFPAASLEDLVAESRVSDPLSA